MCSPASASFQVKATTSMGEAENYAVKRNSEGSHLSPQSSDGRTARELTDKTLPLKPSSRLASLKQKEEMAEKERGAQSLISKEKTASRKEEKTTPKKEKISPKKAEVGAVKVNSDARKCQHFFAGKYFSFITVYVLLM